MIKHPRTFLYSICAIGYLASYLITDSLGPIYLLANSTIALIIFLAAIKVSEINSAKIIMALESAAIFIALMAYIDGYIGYIGYWFEHYHDILGVINLLEFIAIIAGIRWGEFRSNSDRIIYDILWLMHRSARASDNTIQNVAKIQAKTCQD